MNTAELTIEPGMLITNSGNDFKLNSSGFSVPLTGSQAGASSYIIGNDAAALFGLSGSPDTLNLETFNTGMDMVIQTADGKIDILSIGGNVDIAVSAGNYIRLIGLPTSNPGGSGRVWNDGGTLKIT